MVNWKPFCVSLIIAFMGFLQQTSCMARQNCTCNCWTVVVKPNDDPRNVWKDIQPDSMATGCAEVTFVADDPGSHVCLQQIHALSEIQDPNVELVVRENHVEVFALKYTPSKWVHREICSTRNSFTFQLKQLNTNNPFEPDKLFLNFQVVHIESSYRKLYMEGLYCDGTYTMQKSRIEIFSKETNSSRRQSSSCGIFLERKEAGLTNMCLYYELAVSEGMSRDHWSVYVSTKRYSLDPSDLVFRINATSSPTDAWCSDLDSVMLIFERTKSLIHEENVLTIVAQDFNGTREEFLEYFNSKTTSGTTPSSVQTDVSTAHVPFIVPIVVVSLLLIVLVLAVLMYSFPRYVCRKVTKRTAFSNTFVQHQRKYTKNDILVISTECEHKNFLNSL